MPDRGYIKTDYNYTFFATSPSVVKHRGVVFL